MEIATLRIEARDSHTIARRFMHQFAIEAFCAYLGFGDFQIFRIARCRHEIEVGQAQAYRGLRRRYSVDKPSMIHVQMSKEKRHACTIDAKFIDGRIQDIRAAIGRRARIDSKAFATVADQIAVRFRGRYVEERNANEVHVWVLGYLAIMPSHSALHSMGKRPSAREQSRTLRRATFFFRHSIPFPRNRACIYLSLVSYARSPTNRAKWIKPAKRSSKRRNREQRRLYIHRLRKIARAAIPNFHKWEST